MRSSNGLPEVKLPNILQLTTVPSIGELALAPASPSLSFAQVPFGPEHSWPPNSPSAGLPTTTRCAEALEQHAANATATAPRTTADRSTPRELHKSVKGTRGEDANPLVLPPGPLPTGPSESLGGVAQWVRAPACHAGGRG